MRGFSLLEIMVSLAVGSMVTTVMLVTLSGGLNVASHLRGEQEVLLRAERLATRLGPDMRETDLNQARSFPHALAVPVATPHFDVSPHWSGLQLYYLVDHKMCTRRLDLNATDQQIAPLLSAADPAQIVASDIEQLNFRLIPVERIDPVSGAVKAIPLLVEVSATLQFLDRRGHRVERPWSRQFFARNSLLALHHPVLPVPDDAPVPALNLPTIPEVGPLP